MSIASEIQRIQGNITDAYNACASKNATMPATQNSSYLAETINSITGGGGGGGNEVFSRYTMTEYANGVVRVTPVNASGETFFSKITDLSGFTGWANVAAGLQYAFANCYGLRGSLNFCNLVVNMWDVTDYIFQNAFSNCFNVTGEANFCQVANAANGSFSGAFYGCKGITGVNFSGLRYVSSSQNGSFNYAFSGCTNLQNAWFNGPFYVGGGSSSYLTARFAFAFSGCSNLVNVNFGVNYIASDYALHYAFNGCGFNTFNFSLLSTISANGGLRYCFNNCVNLKNLYFPALTSISGTNCMSYMLRLCNDVVVHFRTDRESSWNTLDDFVAGFGGTNTTILFDL